MLDFDKKLSLTKKPSLHGNLIIEGDNLLALKSLLPTHAGKVKCIYIDPPYNTGNEGWVFNDNLTHPIFKEWLGKVVGKEGEDFTRHDKWCCMMYPRLELLKELLRNDGAIFVSIDDNEAPHLRMLMDEVFDRSNFVADIAVVNNLKGRSDDRYVATAHEHLLIYRRSDEFETYGWPIPEEYQDEYTERDDDGEYYRLQGLRKRGAGSKRTDRPDLFYAFYYNEKSDRLSLERSDKSDIEIKPKLSTGEDGRWRWGKGTALKRIDELVARKVEGRNEYDVFQKDALLIGGDLKRIKPKSVWLNTLHSTDTGTRVYKRVMAQVPYPNPKSPYFVADVVRQATKEDDIVLDSFAGSGTTAHAVLLLNNEDNAQRRFILVQMAYETKQQEKDEFNICEKITAERVRRVMSGYSYTNSKGEKLKVKGLAGEFTYLRVGQMLYDQFRNFSNGDFPAYEELARYVFYTETSHALDPKRIDKKTGKIGEHGSRSYYLLYTPNGTDDKALTKEWLSAISKKDKNLKVVYCEKLWVNRDELAAHDTRAMIIPFNLK